MNVSKPMPRDAQVMILLVIGGITSGEVKAIKTVVNEIQPQCEVILLSSHLTYSADIVTHSLVRSPLLSPV